MSINNVGETTDIIMNPRGELEYYLPLLAY